MPESDTPDVTPEPSGSEAPVPAAPGAGEEIVIIGAGPAGLTAAYELAKAGRGSTVLEATGVVGGVLGGFLLTITPASTFDAIVPALLLLATIIFALGERIVSLMKGRSFPHNLGIFAVSVYGGYFNGGLGIVLLALFALMGMTSLPLMNGLKNLLSLILSAASLLVFAVGGLIDWPSGFLMAAFAVVGGYAGAHASRLISKQVLRLIVVITGLVMSLVFFLT